MADKRDWKCLDNSFKLFFWNQTHRIISGILQDTENPGTEDTGHSEFRIQRILDTESTGHREYRIKRIQDTENTGYKE